MTIIDLFTNSQYLLMKSTQKWRTAKVKNSGDFSSFYQKNSEVRREIRLGEFI